MQLNPCGGPEQLKTVVDGANEEPNYDAHVAVLSPENVVPVVKLIQNLFIYVGSRLNFVM